MAVAHSADYEVPKQEGGTHLTQDVPTNQLKLTDQEWEKKLTALQFIILRQKGTEPGHMLRYPDGFDDHFEKGVYHCAGCDAALYTSDMKFDCGCGWPGFWTNVKGAVYEQRDADGFRCEILCSKCDGHMGHVFRGEGFGFVTDERHCVNSLSLSFVPEGKTLADKIFPKGGGLSARL